MLDLIICPDEALLQPSLPVDFESEDITHLKKTIKNMKQIMYKYDGVGLAAVQLGIYKQIIITDCSYDVDNKDTRNTKIYINPKIIAKRGEKVPMTEGCLSCPGVYVDVIRYPEITVEYFDLDGKKHTHDLTELDAHCLQHEIDHLSGKTLFQVCVPEKRIQVLQDYLQKISLYEDPRVLNQTHDLNN
jgi:peptide deformylase